MKLNENNIISIINQLKIQKNNEGKYSFFDAPFSKCLYDEKIIFDNKKIIFDIIYDLDQNCNISKELGDFLVNASNDTKNRMGIHRTKLYDLIIDNNIIYSDMLYDIAKKGIQNFGHLSSGVNEKCPEPSRTLSPLYGITGFINLLSSYKNNNATIIYSFPSEFLNDEMDFTNSKYIKNIYNFEGGKPYIKPEYIVGTIIKNEHGLDIFLTHDEMLKNNNKQK